jgi:peroxiredoxin
VYVARMSLALAGMLVLLPGCSVISDTLEGPPKAASVKPGKDRREAPDFTVKDVNGQTVHLADYRGKVVLLDFWATWCGPCKIEIPWFKEFERENKDKGFAVIGVAMDDEGWDVVKPFAQNMQINYRLVAGNDAIAQKYGAFVPGPPMKPGEVNSIDALPTTFLIDRDGKIAAVHVGLSAKNEFENGIQELLKASGNPAVPALLVRAN